MSVLIGYVVTSPSNIKNRYGQVVTLKVVQDNNGAVLDVIHGDCIQLYPRAGQPKDNVKSVIAMRIGSKYQEFLSNQCGSADPFYDSESVRILDIYTQFFGSLETLKIVWPELWDLIDIEYVDEDGNTQTKQITKIDLEHRWAGDE